MVRNLAPAVREQEDLAIGGNSQEKQADNKENQ